jgi:outer membrane lipoprotein-sorting protein
MLTLASKIEKGRCLRAVLYTVPALFAWALPLRAGADFESTPDPVALVRTMIATYQSATTIQETSEARVNDGMAEYIQASSLKFKKPRLMIITSQDPQTGTLSTYVNAKTITIYSGKQNIYTKRTTPETLQATFALINRAAGESLGMQFIQIFNPASFLLAANGKLREADGFRYVGKQAVDGHNTILIVGRANDALFQKLAPEVKLTPEKRDVALWIDAQSNLLVRCRCLLTWLIAIPAQGTTPARSLRRGLVLDEVHRDSRLNAPISDDEFRFTPPKESREVFQQGQ